MQLRLCLTLVVTGVVVANPAFASAEEALVAFDGLCVATQGDMSTIETMVRAAGGKPVPPEVMNQDPVVARTGGKGFALTRGKLRFIVSATPKGACSLLFPELAAPEMPQLLQKNYSLAKPAVESSGPQTNTLYRIIAPSMHIGGYIMLTVPKPGFGADKALSLGFIPPAMAASMRQREGQ